VTEGGPETRAIEGDLDAIEKALVALGRAARSDAGRRGTTLVDQSMSEEFQSTHSQLAALIKDPVNEVCYLWMEALRVHLQKIAHPDDVGALFQRVTARNPRDSDRPSPTRRACSRSG
jgi:hypothetical protein